MFFLSIDKYNLIQRLLLTTIPLALITGPALPDILITFSGFSSQNPLRELGNLNFWVDSSNYNVIETTHQVWLLAVIEALINQKK